MICDDYDTNETSCLLFPTSYLVMDSYFLKQMSEAPGNRRFFVPVLIKFLSMP